MEAKCSECGKSVGANAVEELCPECLMKIGLGSQSGPAGFTESEAPGRKKPAFIPPKPEEIAAKFPQLEIVELIGRGGMGAVYKARQKQLGRIVALKILPPGVGNQPAFAERFTREARALAALNHAGIVTLYEFGQADGLFFFLMEFVDGMNLRQLLDSGRISPREALAIVPQICDALQYAHDQGIVHRDIKPENILIDRRGRVKVADFGLARLMGIDAEINAGAHDDQVRLSVSLSEAGKILGTPQYMAPEQSDRPGDVDHRADIYSLGVVLYQMLTGELPDKRIEPPSKKVQLDVRLDEIVLRALEKRPELRFQQASELKTQIETVEFPDEANERQTTSRPKRGSLRQWVQRRLLPENTLAIWGQMLCFCLALVVLVLGIQKLTRFDLQPHELFFGVLIVLTLSLSMIVIGLLVVPARRIKTQEDSGQNPPIGVIRPASQSAERATVLGVIALISAILSGLIPTVFFWLKPWLVPDLTPAGQQFMLWLALAAAVIAIVFGAAARKSAMGILSMIVGGINLAIWLLFFFAGIAGYFSTPRPAVSTAVRSEPNRPPATFQPVIEQVIPDLATNRACLLDFESGKLFIPPMEVATALSKEEWNFGPAVLRWLRDHGTDAMLAPDGSVRLIHGVVLSPRVGGRPITWDELNVLQVASSIESVSEEHIQASESQPEFNRTALRAPSAVAFLTRERSSGVLQILGPSENPAGMKIRYKLVQTEKHPNPSPVVRLLAIEDRSKPGFVMWQPNGTEVPEALRAKLTNDWQRSSPRVRWVSVGVSNALDESLVESWTAMMGGDTIARFGGQVQRLPGGEGLLIRFGDLGLTDRTSANVRIGFAIKPWRNLFVWEGGDFRLAHSNWPGGESPEPIDVEPASPTAMDHEWHPATGIAKKTNVASRITIRLPATRREKGNAWQLHVLDKNGKEHLSRWYLAPSNENNSWKGHTIWSTPVAPEDIQRITLKGHFVDEDYHWTEFRGVPLQTGASELSNKTFALQFGPVTEVPLKPLDDSPEQNAEYLDLDTGRRLTKSIFTPGLTSIIWDEQMDIALNSYSHGKLHDIRGFDLAVAPAPTNHWDNVTAQEIQNEQRLRIPPRGDAVFSTVQSVTLNRDRDRTDTYFFRTREGRKGVLQIVGSPAEPDGMKIRYKLVPTN